MWLTQKAQVLRCMPFFYLSNLPCHGMALHKAGNLMINLDFYWNKCIAASCCVYYLLFVLFLFVQRFPWIARLLINGIVAIAKTIGNLWKFLIRWCFFRVHVFPLVSLEFESADIARSVILVGFTLSAHIVRFLLSSFSLLFLAKYLRIEGT